DLETAERRLLDVAARRDRRPPDLHGAKRLENAFFGGVRGDMENEDEREPDAGFLLLESEGVELAPSAGHLPNRVLAVRRFSHLDSLQLFGAGSIRDLQAVNVEDIPDHRHLDREHDLLGRERRRGLEGGREEDEELSFGWRLIRIGCPDAFVRVLRRVAVGGGRELLLEKRSHLSCLERERKSDRGDQESASERDARDSTGAGGEVH